MNKKSEKNDSKKSSDKPHNNWEKKFLSLQKKYNLLKKDLVELEIENLANIKIFKEKARLFEKKANDKILQIKNKIEKKEKNKANEERKFILQKFIEEFLNPFINFETAILSGRSNKNEIISEYVKGFEMILLQMKNILHNYGIEEIRPKIGEKFNPEIHEALMIENNNGDQILKVKSPGYKLNGRTIKPAIVIIGK